LSKSGWSVSATTALAVALVALIVALAGFAIPLIAPYNASSDQVNSLQSQVGLLQKQINSLPVVDEQPTHRIILLEWSNTATAGQDRFNPNFITINQGDTVDLTFIDNDTDGHTFEILLPPGLFILNNTVAGEFNHLTSVRCSLISFDDASKLIIPSWNVGFLDKLVLETSVEQFGVGRIWRYFAIVLCCSRHGDK